MIFEDIINWRKSALKWSSIDKIPVVKEMKEIRLGFEEGGQTLYDHSRNLARTFREVARQCGLKNGDGRVNMLLIASVFHDVGKTKTMGKDAMYYPAEKCGNIGANIFRELFYDENYEIREDLCFIIRHFGEALSYELTPARMIALSQQDLPLSLVFSLAETHARGDESLMMMCHSSALEAMDRGFYNDKFEFSSDVERQRYLLQEKYDRYPNVRKTKEKRSKSKVFIMFGMPTKWSERVIENEKKEGDLCGCDEISLDKFILDELNKAREKHGGAEAFSEYAETLDKDGIFRLYKGIKRNAKRNFKKNVELSLRNGKDVFVRDANLYEKDREFVRKIACEHLAEVIMIVFETPDYFENYEVDTFSVLEKDVPIALKTMEYPEAWECDRMFKYGRDYFPEGYDEKNGKGYVYIPESTGGYLKMFSKKMGILESDGVKWVGGSGGGYLKFPAPYDKMRIKIKDIRTAVDYEIGRELFKEWLDYNNSSDGKLWVSLKTFIKEYPSESEMSIDDFVNGKKE